MNKPSKKISDVEIYGKVFQRKAEFEGIDFLSLSREEALIVWKIFILDDEGNVVDHPDLIQERTHVSRVSNQFRVTAEGITITEEYVKTLHAQEENELDIDYEYRIKGIYNSMFEEGIPEFDFYWNNLFTNPLPTVLDQSIQVIDNLKGFDKKRKNNGTA